MTDELMTVTELMAYTRLTKSSIYDRVHHNRIPYRKLGRSLRFSKAEIDAWMCAPARGPGNRPNGVDAALDHIQSRSFSDEQYESYLLVRMYIEALEKKVR